MDQSNRYKYFSFDPENSILYHYVNSENFSDKESFVTSISNLITLIEKLRPRRMVIEIHKEPGYFELELTDFMQKTLYTTILKAGIKKIAYYVADGKYLAELKKYERNNSISARFFSDMESAKQWVMS